MAEEQKPEQKPTEYVILQHLPPEIVTVPPIREVYGVVGHAEGRGAKQAVDAHLAKGGGDPGIYLTVPLSSFKRFRAGEEQPPPVFRVVELSARPDSGSADDTQSKTGEPSQEQPASQTLSGSAAAAGPEDGSLLPDERNVETIP